MTCSKVKERNGMVLMSSKWKKFVEIFSDQVQCKKLISSNLQTDIHILNPMRVLSMLVMILGHFHETTQMLAINGEDFRNPKLFLWLCSNATIFIGTFFVIGGALTNYVTLCKYAKNEIVNVNGKEEIIKTMKASVLPWSLMIVNRYIRLICLYFFFILFFTYIVPNVIYFIPYVKLDPLIQCPPRMLEHIFMISNFDYRPHCMIWAWYLDVDFQLFVLSRPVVWLFVYKPFWAFVTSVCLVFGSCIIRIILRAWFDLAPVMSYIMQFPQYNSNYLLNHLINHSKPYTWMSSYVVGMMFGFAAFHLRFKSSYKLKPSVQKYLWFCTVSIFLWSVFGIFWNGNGFKDEIYDGFYIAFSPLLWSIACGWLILHSHVFSTSASLKKFYQLKIFTCLSNLSYGCCLVNLPVAYLVMSFNAYIIYKEPKIYLSYTMFCIYFVLTCMLSYLGSFILYLIAEGPASNIRLNVSKQYSKSESKKLKN